MKKILLGNKALSGRTVVALGKFDGIHAGHAKLLEYVVDYASKYNAQSVVYAMEPESSVRITDFDERTEIIRSFGIDVLCTEQLTEEFMNMSPEEFVSKILQSGLDACHVVVGYNFRFGKNRSGDAKLLEVLCNQRGIGVTVADCVYISEKGDDVAVSSTLIRSLASEGRVDEIFPLLGRNYSISGVVQKGKQLGRTLDFPTANIYKIPEDIILKSGVYLTKVSFDDKSCYAITNVGTNPTVENPNGILRIESYLKNFVGNLYGKHITVEFVKFIRDEHKFSSATELRNQLVVDKKHLDNV